MNKYYITSRKGDDEFTLGTTENKDEAIKLAREEWRGMNYSDRKNNEITVRQYVNDIEDEDCENFDYNTTPWQIWTADRETGTLIDHFGTYSEAESAIEEYEEIDREDGHYEENFYDIVNEDHEHIEE